MSVREAEETREQFQKLTRGGLSQEEAVQLLQQRFRCERQSIVKRLQRGNLYRSELRPPRERKEAAAHVPKWQARHRSKMRALRVEDEGSNTTVADRTAAQALELAADQLRQKILEQFWRFEKRHGLKKGEGQTLLMDTGLAQQRSVQIRRR